MAKSQKESEQPAKVYQLDAVEAKVDDALKKLDIIVTQTSGVVSQTQLHDAIKEVKEYTDNEIADAKQSVLDKFTPMQKAINKFVWLIVGGVVAVITQAVIIYVIAKG